MATKTFEIMLESLELDDQIEFLIFDGASIDDVQRFVQTGCYDNFDIYPIATIEREIE